MNVAKASFDAYFRFSSGDFSGRATTATTATMPAATSTSISTTIESRITLLGDGTWILSCLTLSHVVSTTTHLRQMLHARDQLPARQSHCHPHKWDQISGNKFSLIPCWLLIYELILNLWIFFYKIPTQIKLLAGN